MFKLSERDARSLSFLDEPTFYSAEEYAHVRRCYVEGVVRLPGVAAVYQMGSVGAPGVSDLDLIVVLSGSGPFSSPRAFSTAELGATGRYLFMHPGAMVMHTGAFFELDLLIYASQLTHLHGSELPRRTLDEEDSRGVSTAILIDHSIHLLHQLLRALVSRVVYVRRSLMAISGIAHTLRVAERSGLAPLERWTTYMDHVLDLKHRWFQRQDHRELVSLMEEGINVVVDILVELERHLLRGGILALEASGEPVLRIIRHSFNAFTLFTHHPEEILSGGLGVLGKRSLRVKVGLNYVNASLSVLPVPAGLYLHHWAYTTGETDLARTLRSDAPLSRAEARPRGRIDEAYRALMARRVDLWGRNLKFLSDHNLLEYDVMPFPGSRHVYIRGRGLRGWTTSLVENLLGLRLNRLLFRTCLLPRLHRLAPTAPRGPTS